LDYEETVDVSEKCGAVATDFPLATNVNYMADEPGEAQHSAAPVRPPLAALRAGAAHCSRGAALAGARLARFRAPAGTASRPAGASVTSEHHDTVTVRRSYSANIDSGKYCC